MSDSDWPLAAAPIIEAVVDIDCDMPPTADVDALQAAATAVLGDRYPVARRRLFDEHQIVAGPTGPPNVTSRQGIQALQFVSADGKQLVQFRPGGYSFNRLAPYATFDDYRPEIERCWGLFVSTARPVLTRVVRMRYINRFDLPLLEGQVELGDYLKLAPRVADEGRLRLAGFFNQSSQVEPATGNQANVVFATQGGGAEHLGLIFDIEALKEVNVEPSDWATISAALDSLRSLKNLIFRNSLTKKCLNLFRP